MIILPSTRGFPKVRQYISPSSWDITYQTSVPNQVAKFTAPGYGATGVNITINWGDGVTTNYTTTGDMTHTYTSLGTYLIKLNVSFASNGSIRYSVTNDDVYSIINTSAIPYIPGLRSGFAFGYLFNNCRGLTSLPEDLFRYNPQINLGTMEYAFNFCQGLTSLPANLLRYNTGSIGTNEFYGTFANCTGLTSIPVDFLKYNTNTRSMQFAFSYCSSLQNIDPDLIRYMPNFGGLYASLSYTFAGCTLDTSSYSNFLNSIDTYRSDLGSCTLTAGGSRYNSSASTARANLISRGWSISDGGLI